MLGRPPSASVISGAGVSHLADRSPDGLHGGSMGMLEHLLKAAGGMHIADTAFFRSRHPPLLNCVPFFKRQGDMCCIPESFIHTVGFTDMDICIAAKGVYDQMRCQRSATPQAFGRIYGVTVCIELLSLRQATSNSPLG